MDKASNLLSSSKPTMSAVGRFKTIILSALLCALFPAFGSCDEIKLLADNSIEYQGQKIILTGISVPHSTAKCLLEGKKWPCGATATLRLNELLKKVPLECEFEQDFEGVTLARCKHADVDLATQLLTEGWAVTVGEYAEYEFAQNRAKQQQLGIWRGGFVPPDQWRQYPETLLNPYLDLICSVCAERKH